MRNDMCVTLLTLSASQSRGEVCCSHFSSRRPIEAFLNSSPGNAPRSKAEHCTNPANSSAPSASLISSSSCASSGLFQSSFGSDWFSLLPFSWWTRVRQPRHSAELSVWGPCVDAKCCFPSSFSTPDTLWSFRFVACYSSPLTYKWVPRAFRTSFGSSYSGCPSALRFCSYSCRIVAVEWIVIATRTNCMADVYPGAKTSSYS